MGWYVNHSSKPNIEKLEDGFHAIQNIDSGDELTMDYNSLNEPNDKKEKFYQST